VKGTARLRNTHPSAPSSEILRRSRTEFDLLHPFYRGHVQVIPIFSHRRQEEDEPSARDKHVSSEDDQVVHKIHHLVGFRYGLIARHAVNPKVELAYCQSDTIDSHTDRCDQDPSGIKVGSSFCNFPVFSFRPNRLAPARTPSVIR
jgi:hypothetical protein